MLLYLIIISRIVHVGAHLRVNGRKDHDQQTKGKSAHLIVFFLTGLIYFLTKGLLFAAKAKTRLKKFKITPHVAIVALPMRGSAL